MKKPMSAMPSLVTTTQPATQSTAGLQEQIRRRAYELHEQRGRVDGCDLDDWLQAESELTRPKAKAAAM
jgi:hypothetical protein